MDDTCNANPKNIIQPMHCPPPIDFIQLLPHIIYQIIGTIYLPIQLFRFLSLNELEVFEGAGDGGDDNDGTYSPLSYRYEDPTRKYFSTIHMHNPSSCVAMGHGWSKRAASATWSRLPKRGRGGFGSVYSLSDSVVVVAYTSVPTSMHRTVSLYAQKYHPYPAIDSHPG